MCRIQNVKMSPSKQVQTDKPVAQLGQGAAKREIIQRLKADFIAAGEETIIVQACQCDTQL